MKVEIDDLELGVRYQRGDKVTKDCSCDSKWMLETMNEVGKAIRDAHHWVKWDPQNIQESDVTHLMMDNAGGHGSNEALRSTPRTSKTNIRLR